MRSLIPTVLVILLPVGVSAQDGPDLWRSRLEFGFTGASGNTSFSILSAAASLNRLDQERFEFDVTGRFRWGSNDERVIANDMQGTLKLDWKRVVRWSARVKFDHEFGPGTTFQHAVVLRVSL